MTHYPYRASVVEMTRNGAVPSRSSSFFPWLLFLFFAMIPPHQGASSSVTFDLSQLLFGEMVKDSKTDESENTKLSDCVECEEDRCPENSSKCLLGTVSDPCGCCKQGICARLGGEPCWNSSIPELSPKSRKDGLCARNYFCQLRSDLQEKDEPEAICTCMEQTLACGSNEMTYETPCALHEEAMRFRNPLSLKLLHLGPCLTRPWIVSYTEKVVTTFGQRVLLICETKAFPVPDIYWEFHSADGKKVIKLQGEEHEISVRSDQDSKALTTTSWLQVPRLTREYVGTYHCIANNSIGESGVASVVSMA